MRIRDEIISVVDSDTLEECVVGGGIGEVPPPEIVVLVLGLWLKAWCFLSYLST